MPHTCIHRWASQPSPFRVPRYTWVLFKATRRCLIAVLHWLLIILSGVWLWSALTTWRGFTVLSVERGEPFLWRKGPQLALFVREVSARTLCHVLSPLYWLHIPTPFGAESSNRPPVLLIPSAAYQKPALSFLATFLRSRGWRVAIASFKGRVDDLSERAKELSSEVARLREETGDPKVDLVAFSRGGLFAAWYCQHLDGQSSTRRIVTLATPWGGTRTAIFHRGSARRELRLGNPVLEHLVPPTVPTTCIWSTHDPHVVPPESSVAGHGVAAMEMEHGGHFELLFSARAYRSVETALILAPRPVAIRPDRKA